MLAHVLISAHAWEVQTQHIESTSGGGVCVCVCGGGGGGGGGKLLP